MALEALEPTPTSVSFVDKTNKLCFPRLERSDALPVGTEGPAKPGDDGDGVHINAKTETRWSQVTKT